VHEAYVRLVDRADSRDWANRGHFFAAAAEAMRRILVESARRKKRLRHGGGRQRVELAEEHLIASEAPEDVLAVDEALEKLAAQDSNAAALVKLLYFAGLTVEEAAQTLGISPRTAYRDWAYARAWLFRCLNKDTVSSRS
jgi:RNA polymerase sigma factor (TIGR02999 family)